MLLTREEKPRSYLLVRGVGKAYGWKHCIFGSVRYGMMMTRQQFYALSALEFDSRYKFIISCLHLPEPLLSGIYTLSSTVTTTIFASTTNGAWNGANDGQNKSQANLGSLGLYGGVEYQAKTAIFLFSLSYQRPPRHALQIFSSTAIMAEIQLKHTTAWGNMKLISRA